MRASTRGEGFDELTLVGGSAADSAQERPATRTNMNFLATREWEVWLCMPAAYRVEAAAGRNCD